MQIIFQINFTFSQSLSYSFLLEAMLFFEMSVCLSVSIIVRLSVHLSIRPHVCQFDIRPPVFSLVIPLTLLILNHNCHQKFSLNKYMLYARVTVKI